MKVKGGMTCRKGLLFRFESGPLLTRAGGGGGGERGLYGVRHWEAPQRLNMNGNCYQAPFNYDCSVFLATLHWMCQTLPIGCCPLDANRFFNVIRGAFINHY